MEKINGVDFEEYAAACANLAQGMSEEQIIDILGLEKPVWDDTLNQWNNKLGELMAQDMEYATKYSNIFLNPKVGRFANAKAAGADIGALLLIVPNYEIYQDIFWHMAVAADYGIDGMSILDSYKLDIGKWGALNMHYMQQGLNSLNNDDPSYNDQYEYYTALMHGLREKWEEHYNDSEVDLGSDIAF